MNVLDQAAVKFIGLVLAVVFIAFLGWIIWLIWTRWVLKNDNTKLQKQMYAEKCQKDISAINSHIESEPLDKLVRDANTEWNKSGNGDPKGPKGSA